MTNTQIAQIRDEVAALLTSRLAAVPTEAAALQRAARALRQSESIDQWIQIVADAAAAFAARVALFSIDGDRVVAKALRGPGELPAEPVALSEAPALQQVIDSKELVVCLTAASQLGGALFSPALAKRAHLLPVVGKSRVLGILYAEGDANLPALETLTALAAGSLELRKVNGTAPLIQPAAMEPEHRHPVEPVAAVAAAPVAAEAVDWRAQRGASVAVAKLILQHGETLAEGRARGKVYAALRLPIEAARLEFRDRFPGKENYLEAEFDARLF
jgi:hypothetical protein